MKVSMSQYSIVEVNKKRDLMKFIKFPDRLYENCEQYVPEIHSSQVHALTTSPALMYCIHKLWMVLNEKEEVVGRICAIINPRYNELYNKSRARFGWFDCINSPEVAALLFSTAENWAKTQGMTEIHGPLFYNTLGKQGMLVEGFENTPPFNCLYNYPYYNELISSLGYVKECDWIQYKIPLDQELPEKAVRISSILREKYKLKEGSIDKLKKRPDMVKKFFQLYNEAFAEAVYNFIPFTEEEIEEEARMAIPMISDKISSVILDENDEPIAFGIAFPNISEALKKAKGSLFPFGWFHISKALRNFETIDLMIDGAAPKWQNRGISAMFYVDSYQKYKASGVKWAIANPQLETNEAIKLWGKYRHELFMRRRCYIKKL